MLVINFKTYSEATGRNARKAAEEIEKAAKETGREVMVAPASEDLLRLEDLELEVFSQHVDPVDAGSHTGHSLPSAVREAGATGTLINHSEKRMSPEGVEEAVKKARENGLTTIVCAQDPEECGRLSGFDPDFIAYEPPELIGGDTSVSEAKPGLIEKAVERSDVPVLTGAGIHTREDVEKSMELGCEGVLVASGIVKSDDIYSSTVELVEGL